MRIKEHETRLTLQEHDDDDDDEINTIQQGEVPRIYWKKVHNLNSISLNRVNFFCNDRTVPPKMAILY